MTTPRDEPQRQPLRCETCEYGEFEGNGSVRCKGDYLPPNYVSLIETRGCFSHSANTGTQARIDAVVKELEKAVKKSEGDLDGTRNTEIAYRNGMLRAIALLKEGVGK